MKPITVKAVLEVLEIAENGWYQLNEQRVELPFTAQEMHKADVYTAKQALSVSEAFPKTEAANTRGMTIRLRNQDTLSAARELNGRRLHGEKPVLVLNFANPRRPGGGIRETPYTQEERLCHDTTLFASLQSKEAWTFYQENLDCGTMAQTDALILSPHVMVLRDAEGRLCAEPFPAAVMTISAPIAKRMKPEEKAELEAVLLQRIRVMLRVAMAEGYRKMVLGAWGCGAFGNDADAVARLFHQALTEGFGEENQFHASDFFDEVTMAVMDQAEGSPRYHSFARYFEE